MDPTELAVASYRAAIKADPRFGMPHTNLGVLLMDVDDDGAIAEFRQAIDKSPKDIFALTNLALILRKRGEIDAAVECYQKALAIKPNDAEALCYIGLSLRQQGKFEDSLNALQRGDRLGSQLAKWTLPSGQWLRETERMRQLNERLPGVLSGGDQGLSFAELMEFANLCRELRRFGEALQIYTMITERNPRIIPRYPLACAAIRSAAGDGVNPPEPAARALLRQKALDWLRTDLKGLEKALATAAPAGREQVRRILGSWLKDYDLASVRDPAGMAKLPKDEQPAWQSLWADVRRLAGNVKVAEMPPQRSPESDVERLRGTWIMVSATVQGQTDTMPAWSNAFASIQKDEITMTLERGILTGGTFVVDSSRSPSRIDITDHVGLNKGKTLPGIFRFDQRELWLCMGMAGEPAPTEFSGLAGIGQMLLRYRRLSKLEEAVMMGNTPAESWVKQSSPKGYEIQFPMAPNVDGGDSMSLHLMGNGYEFVCSPRRNAGAGSDAEILQRRVNRMAEVLGVIFRTTESKVQNRYPALDAVAEREGGKSLTRFRVVIAGDLVFQIAVTGERAFAESNDAARLLNSLVIGPLDALDPKKE